MITYIEARRRHALLGDVPKGLAAEAWLGMTGQGHGLGSEVTRAVAETIPDEYAALVGYNDLAAAFACACMARAFSAEPGARGYAARKVAELGWAEFREVGDRGGHVAHGAGCDDSDPWPITKALDEVDANPKKMRAIADLAGRMYEALRGARQKRTPHVREEIVGVELGDDFAGLVPSEYAMLATGPTTSYLMRQITERKAMQFRRAGTEKQAKGPLVILRDESGSMMYPEERNTWAAAAMTALTRIAWEGKREVVVVHFSTATQADRLLPGDHAALVRAQATFIDGGTNIAHAIRAGCAEIRALEKRGQRGADAVIISDGNDGSRHIPGALDGLEALGARLWSVAIDARFSGPLKDRAAKYIELSSADMDAASVIAVGDSA